MKKLRFHFLFVALLLTVASIRCSSGSNLLKSGSPLFSALGGVPNLSSITNLLKTPGLDKLLGSAMKKPFTLLAPTNDALNGLGADALGKLSNPANINQLASLLKDHIVPGKLDAASLMKSGLQSAGGKALDLGNAQLGNLISGDKFNVFPVDKILGAVTNATP
jgi:uncharacterized surface protein with fasciclin (FAS1) repeats